jgi:hypothetical protein
MMKAWGWVRARVPLRLLVWGAILALTALGLGFVPLFNVLGFDFAFAMGLVTAPAAVEVGHLAGARARVSDSAANAWRTAAQAALWALALLLLPLFISLAGALRVRNCNLGAGFAFYLLLPVATAIFAAPLGAMVGLTVRRGSRLLALALPIFSIIWTLLRLYRDPPAFALDPFGGYFPGPIYDEAMRPPERLFFYRAANLVWVATAVAITAAVQKSRAFLTTRGAVAAPRSLIAALGGALVLVGASLALYFNRAPLGFHVDKAYLQTVLRRQTSSPHFVVLSDPAGDGTPEDRALVIRDLEFRYAQLAKTLGATPAGPVTVYLFPNAEAKKNLVGAGGTLYAKPWSREIFVQSDRFPARHLRHELAHIFAGAFGDPIFGIALDWRLPLPRLASGLVEGIAEAADYGDPSGRATVHQEARAMILAGLAPPLDKVVGAGFTTVAGARAYTIAGSFTHFLLATHGPDKLRAIYHSGGDFEGVYGQTLAALEKEWRAFLDRQPVDAQDKARAKERFRRPAIFQKVCARDIAARIETARGHLYSLPDEAVAIFASVCADDPGEPAHKLSLAEAEFAAGKADAALATAQAMLANEELTDPLRARAATLAANIHYHAGRFAEATAAVAKAQAFATDEGEQRSGIARTRALADPTARATLGRILFGDSPIRGVDGGLLIYLADRFARAFPDEALGPYMLGRQLAFRDPKLALPPLAEACPLDGSAEKPKPLPPLFRAECHRLIGEAAFRAGDFVTSARAWEAHAAAAEKSGTIGDRLRARDFLARIAWERQRRESAAGGGAPF